LQEQTAGANARLEWSAEIKYGTLSDLEAMDAAKPLDQVKSLNKAEGNEESKRSNMKQ